MLFATFGPFIVNADIEMKSYDLGQKFDAAQGGLNDASGVYIFAYRKNDRVVPVYVGKAQKRSFATRLQEHLNANRFSDILEDCTRELVIFLIARVDRAGKFLRVGIDDQEEFKIIDKLEYSLIGACIRVNPELLNLLQLKPQDDIYVPGYRDGLGRTTLATDISAHELAKMLKGKF